MDTRKIYRVPKRSVDVRLVLAETQRLECSVFLAESSSKHDGQESLDEFLNEDERYFIPVHVLATDRNILVSKKLIVTLTAPMEDETRRGDYDMIPTASPEVRVDLFNGDSIDGQVHIFGEVQHSRVSDFLNDTRQFLPVFCESEIIFINRDFIRSVEDRTQQGS
ncbi:MAG TPA: hypothetical protein PK014_00805 [Thermoanaerobaculia bacterium]|nr:hypothetical protein [Thermoanaerobaculia bacterium]HUM29708.1 hypothetical protein [Thermoanaerobaculia bacterium]HXK67008.1 hypothetical protein [Thermoanaerobaculia bacterium]